MGRFHWSYGEGLPFSLMEALTTVERARGSLEPYYDAVIAAHKVASMFGSTLTYIHISDVTTVVSISGRSNGQWSMDKL